MSTPGLTLYELERHDRIAANEIAKKSLGLTTSAEVLADRVKKAQLQQAQRRQRPDVAVVGPPKKSARLACKVPTTSRNGEQRSENEDMCHRNEELDGDCEEEEDADEELRPTGSGEHFILISRSSLKNNPQHLHIDSGADSLVPSSEALTPFSLSKDTPQTQILSEQCS